MSHSIKFCGLFYSKEQTSLLKNTGLEFDTFLQKQWHSMDKERKRKQNYVVRNTWKEKCKLKKRPEIKKTKQDAFQKSGVQ